MIITSLLWIVMILWFLFGISVLHEGPTRISFGLTWGLLMLYMIFDIIKHGGQP